MDGPELVNFMIDYGVGVTKIETYDVFKVDENFFGEAN
jgi:restriction endonuclease Mrr